MNTQSNSTGFIKTLHFYYQKHKRKFTLIITVLALIFIGYPAFYSYRHFIPKHITPGEFILGKADVGPVLKTMEGEGIVVPENEVFLRAYSSGVIKRIINSPGSHIKAGEVILLMDTEQIEKEIENANDQLAVMKNNLWKNRLNDKSTRVDLDYNTEMKKLRIASIKSDLADQEQLLDVGGISPAKIEKTKQELVIAEKDLETTQQKNSIRLKQLDAEEEGLLLQISMKEKEIEEKNETFRKMTVRATSAGIVLNIYGKEGEKINGGDLLVQISNMTSFKINASVNEDFADIIKTGGEVLADLNDEYLTGLIGRVQPVIANNKINFEVFLKENSHPDLIPNMKVKLQIVKARRDSVIRVPIGQAFNESGKQYAFILENDKAVRREIVTGLRGNEFLEIISGININDSLILSDISSYRHMKEVNIEN
ncbi:MAG: efflux RND transporter periplasmic adaptor subunit [Bacteroidales bacterium]|nr:efflux RND transporter periplasmic adaptor subunit [Bacteroidales bacterium]MCB8998623.1 efflux RND transporter periplasmic adaptor subunit [Bacteroidales bacterium]MCB9012509.1 efflux RND transporter periplasmic adaptor subunit [Bacteroidales bacterium]